MKKKNKPLDFSKRIYIYNILLVSIIIIASFTLMFLSGRLAVIDLSPLSVIIPSAFAELGLHTGFYLWKAKVENCRKYLSAAEQLEKMKLEMNNLINDISCHESDIPFATDIHENNENFVAEMHENAEMDGEINGNIFNAR